MLNFHPNRCIYAHLSDFKTRKLEAITKTFKPLVVESERLLVTFFSSKIAVLDLKSITTDLFESLLTTGSTFLTVGMLVVYTWIVKLP